MTVNKKLNDDYFETKKKYKENRLKSKKMTFRKRFSYFILAILLLLIQGVLLRKCQNRIDENQKNDIENIAPTPTVVGVGD